MRSRKWQAVIMAAVIGLSATACGGSHASVKGCEQALAREVSSALSSGSTASPAVPSECKGLSPADQRKAAEKVARGLKLGG